MRDTGEFIGNYRILTKLSSHMAGELYIVEHTFRANSAALLLLWPSVELNRDEDRSAFQQKSAGSAVQGGSSYIPILDTGIEQQHP